jgi:cbb3-type cytochrome oxidase subunit 1
MGGARYWAGMFVRAWNTWMTATAGRREPAPPLAVTAAA